MKLFIKDRIALIQMLPKEGSLNDILYSLEILKKIRIEQPEKEELDLIDTDRGVQWNTTKDVGKEIDFKFEEIQLLKGIVNHLDVNKKINLANFDVCLKIKNL